MGSEETRSLFRDTNMVGRHPRSPVDQLSRSRER